MEKEGVRIQKEKDENLDILIISNEFSENRWQECSTLGVYTLWNGPENHKEKLRRSLGNIFSSLVSITTYVKYFLYIHCINVKIRNKLFALSKYFYKFYPIKFMAWEPNFNELSLRKCKYHNDLYVKTIHLNSIALKL